MKNLLVFTAVFLMLQGLGLADEYYFKDGRVKEAKAEYALGPYIELNFLENPQEIKGLFIYDIVKVKGPSSFSSDVYSRSCNLLEKGNFNFRRGRFAQALDYYQQALDINPVFLYAYHNRAVVFAAERKYDDAIYEYKKLLKHDEDNPGAYFNLGIIYRYLENWPQAKFYFEKARKYFLRLKDKDKAEEWSQKAGKYLQEAEKKLLQR